MPQTLTPPSHLTRKGGVFYYRRVLPGGARHQIAVSLSTRGFRKAEHLAEVLDGTFSLAIGRVRMANPEATLHEISAIVREYLREELASQLSTEMTPRGSVPVALWPLKEIE